MAERWHIDGHYLMACNCDFGCPCNFNAPPTPGYCEGVLAFAVSEGRFGDVALDGLKAAMIAKWPGAIHEGNGKAALYLDEAATEPQRVALQAILSGDVGGPFGFIIKNTVTELDGPHFARIEAAPEGQRTRIWVDGVVAVEFDAIRNAVTGDESYPRVVLPQGVWSHELEQYTTSRFEAGAGELAMSHPGKVAQVAEVHWQGP